jgi:imidazolonepropionase-like amidohydrolase
MNHLTIKTLLLGAGMTLSLTALAAATLVKDVRVFDGERMHAKRSVLIDGAKIVNANFSGAAPAGATVVNGAGRTLLPGLIDSHVHAYQHQALPLLFGVTTQIDMFTGVPVMQEAARKMAAGANSDQADLFSAGTLATAPGGHGTQFGMPIPTLSRPDQAQSFVDARIAEGSRFIKIVMEDGSAGMPKASLDTATVTALIKAAHLRGKRAVVHVSTLASARSALAAGADGLVHLFNGTHIAQGDMVSLVQLAKARRAFVIPTLCVLESIAGVKADDVLGDAQLVGLLERAQLDTLRSPYRPRPDAAQLAVPRALTLALQRSGVPVLAGTDAGNQGTQYGISLHHEMAALVQAGLTPLQALAAATSTPADAFGLGRRGRIRNGYKADLLLVEGDPGSEIASTRRIVAVWKDGVDAAPLRSSARERVAAQDKPGASAPLALPADGRISLFSKVGLASPFGFGWAPSHDGFMGGKSGVTLQVQQSEGDVPAALAVNASVQPGFAFPWAGLAFMPGAQPMQPANLSGAKVIRFKVRGDGKQYSLSMMSKGVQIPVSQPFTAEAAWREVTIAFSSLKGIDASMITMISFNAGPEVGNYAFQIADVRLLNE